MSKLINIIVEYNKLSQNDKELFKQVIGISSEKVVEKTDQGMKDFLKKVTEESIKKSNDKHKTFIDPYTLIRPYDSNRQIQIFGNLSHATI